MSGDPVNGEQNPRREFLRRRSPLRQGCGAQAVCGNWTDSGYELLTRRRQGSDGQATGQQLKKKSD
jgi:hypothetical protein